MHATSEEGNKRKRQGEGEGESEMGRLLGHTRIFAKGGAIKNIEARTIETKCQNYRLETKCENVDKKAKRGSEGIKGSNPKWRKNRDKK